SPLQVLAPVGPGVRALPAMLAAMQDRFYAPSPSPESASEWMARSYWLQSKLDVEAALRAARSATARSADFGAAWVRVAELEFGFGRTTAAAAALARGLKLSPRNAQGMALQGFLL